MSQNFQIYVKGHLDNSWSDWMSGLTIIHQDNGNTLLVGALPDQGALHGVLNRLRDLGVPLISVNATDQPVIGGKKESDEPLP
jgi:hypothetical protein